MDEETIPEIESQLTTALQQAQASGDDSGDTMKETMKSVLDQYGVDTDQLQQYMQTHRHHRPAIAHARPAVSSTTVAADNAVDVKG